MKRRSFSNKKNHSFYNLHKNILFQRYVSGWFYHREEGSSFTVTIQVTLECLKVNIISNLKDIYLFVKRVFHK